MLFFVQINVIASDVVDDFYYSKENRCISFKLYLVLLLCDIFFLTRFIHIYTIFDRFYSCLYSFSHVLLNFTQFVEDTKIVYILYECSNLFFLIIM